MERSGGAPRRWTRDPATVVSALALVGYFVIARVVLNLFPFSTFSMYAASAAGVGGDVRGCRLLAVGADGRALDVTAFRAWDCPPSWEEAARRSIPELGCDAHRNVEHHTREY